MLWNPAVQIWIVSDGGSFDAGACESGGWGQATERAGVVRG